MNLEVVVDGERRAMQMSTSRNLAVWLHEALDRFPADPLRFYLASNLPETGGRGLLVARVPRPG